MAEYAVNSLTSAVTGELTSRVFSGLIQRYGKDAATSEKLQRLEMLLIKIHSAVEASEKRTIKNSWLLRWRGKLKEAASQGDEVLARFLQRAKDAQASSNTNNGNQRQGEAVSSSAAAPSTDVGPRSFARNSLSNMVQGICNARKMLFSRDDDDDMGKLKRTLGRLEKLSPDIGEFIRLLYLETLPKLCQTPYMIALSTEVHGRTKMGEREKKRMKSSSLENTEEISEDILCENSEPDVVEVTLVCDSYSATLQKEHQFMLLYRLEAAFAEIYEAVELADSHDLEDLEWLAYWAGILREAKDQGRDVLGTTSACKTVNNENNEEAAVECDQEEDELVTLVHRLEDLARDVEYFSRLVYLCPAR